MIPVRLSAPLRALPLCLLLAACATKAPPPPVPPPPPPEPTAVMLNEADRLALKTAIGQVVTRKVDEVVGWASAGSPTRGAVKILRDGYDPQNRPCREFHSVIVQGKLHQHATGFICRQPDGAWEVVETNDYPVAKVPGA